MIDVIAGEALLNKIEDEACNLIKETVLNNYQWSNEWTHSQKDGGKFDVVL